MTRTEWDTLLADARAWLTKRIGTGGAEAFGGQLEELLRRARAEAERERDEARAELAEALAAPFTLPPGVLVDGTLP